MALAAQTAGAKRLVQESLAFVYADGGDAWLEADGQVWHLPAAEPLAGRQFLALLFEEAGYTPRVGVASRPMIRIGGLFNPLLRELNETLYQFEQPFVSDASKFQAAFGPFAPTPHREAVRRTVDWFRRRDTV